MLNTVLCLQALCEQHHNTFIVLCNQILFEILYSGAEPVYIEYLRGKEEWPMYTDVQLRSFHACVES